MKKEMQQRYIELQMLQQQMQQVNGQLEAVGQQIAELNATREAIEDISKVQNGTEMIIPLSSGIFARGTLQENKELIINVGAGVAVEKTADESKKMIEAQIDEMEKFRQDIGLNLKKMTLKACEIEEEISKISK